MAQWKMDGAAGCEPLFQTLSATHRSISNSPASVVRTKHLKLCQKISQASIKEAVDVEAASYTLTTTPKMHLGKKHPVTELKILSHEPQTAG